MKEITKLSVLSAVLVVLCLCSHGIASAIASPPPPAELWFTFIDDTSAEPVTLEGVQLVVCETPLCGKQLYVQQYGTCDTEGCILGLPKSPAHYTFDCANNLCRLTSYPYYESTYFKIVAQFSDGTRASAPRYGLPLTWQNCERAWTIEIQGADLVVDVDMDFVRPVAQPLRPLLLSLALTLGVELTVASIALWYLKRDERELLIGRLQMIFWINILSYPLVWLVFPVMRQFQEPQLQIIGPCVGILVPVYAIALVWIYRAREEKRMLRIGITCASLLGVAVCLSILSFIVGYGSRTTVTLSGLPNDRALLYAEVSTIVLEWILLYVLNRKQLSWVLAGALSLAMNLASFLVGQLVF